MSVKEEIVNVCYGCLSADRYVTPLGGLSNIFYNIIKPESCVYENILLCWECRSILKKTWTFQQRVQQAQITMQSPEFLLNYTTTSLSTLQIKVIDNNCDIIQINKDDERKFKQEIEQDFNEIGIEIDNKINDEELSDDEIKDELKEVVVPIKNEGIESLIQNKAQVEIEIEQIDTKVDSNIDDESSDELTDEFKVEVIDKLKKPKKKSVNRRNKIIGPKKWRYEKHDLSATIGEIKNFYVKGNLNYDILKEAVERRLTTKCTLKERYFCKICDVGFYLYIDLIRHETILHLPSEGPYRCCECDVRNTGRLNTAEELYQHLSTHVIYKCCLCTEIFNTEPCVLRHFKGIHRYQYRCLECTDYFYTYYDIAVHYDKMHPAFTCDKCGKTFKSKRAIETHIKFIHLPSACDICGRVCATAKAVDSHKRLNHPKKRNGVTELSYCVECNLQFDSVYKYKKHLNHAVAHKPPVPMKIPCPECGKIYSSKATVKNHYDLVHLKKTKHYCEICNRYFARPGALRKHKQRIHERNK